MEHLIQKPKTTEPKNEVIKKKVFTKPMLMNRLKNADVTLKVYDRQFIAGDSPT